MASNPIFSPNESDGVAEDASDVAQDPFTGGGELALPGASEFIHYKLGDEYPQASQEAGSQVPGLDELMSLLPSEDGSQAMAGISREVGPMRDASIGLGASALPFFNDGEHQADGGGTDAMRGIDVSGSRPAPIPLIAGTGEMQDLGTPTEGFPMPGQFPADPTNE